MSRGSILIAALALVVAGCGGDDGGDAAPEATFPPTTVSPPGPDGAFEAGSEVAIELEEQSGSGQTGTATLTATEAGTQVVVDVSPPGEAPQPAHIHSGGCENLGGVVYPLENVTDGHSQRTVEASLEDLVAGEFAINVHESEEAIETYTACGEIIPRGD